MIFSNQQWAVMAIVVISVPLSPSNGEIHARDSLGVEEAEFPNEYTASNINRLRELVGRDLPVNFVEKFTDIEISYDVTGGCIETSEGPRQIAVSSYSGEVLLLQGQRQICCQFLVSCRVDSGVSIVERVDFSYTLAPQQ